VNTLTTLKRGLAEILALKLLLEDDMYGYQIVRIIYDRSSGNVSFTEGALYTVLYKLELDGFVSSTNVFLGSSKRRRRYYHVTDTGRVYAGDEIAKYECFAVGIMNVLHYSD